MFDEPSQPKHHAPLHLTHLPLQTHKYHKSRITHKNITEVAESPIILTNRGQSEPAFPHAEDTGQLADMLK